MHSNILEPSGYKPGKLPDRSTPRRGKREVNDARWYRKGGLEYGRSRGYARLARR